MKYLKKFENTNPEFDRLDDIDWIKYAFSGDKFKEFLDALPNDKLDIFHSWVKEWYMNGEFKQNERPIKLVPKKFENSDNSDSSEKSKRSNLKNYDNRMFIDKLRNKLKSRSEGYKFSVGDRVVVNTGGEDIIAIIDYGHNTEVFRREDNSGVSYRCRFTDDIKKTFFGGAKYGIGSNPKDFSSDNNTLHKNAQFIDESSIRLARFGE